MSTEIKATGIAAEIMADLEAIMAHVNDGTPIDPELSQRVTKRGARVTEAIREKFGQTDIANDLIRSTRDEA